MGRTLARTLRGLLPIIGLVAVAACASTSEEEEEEELSALSERGTRTLAIDEDVSVLVEHPETLLALESRGFDLGSRLAGGPLADNAAFAASVEGKAIISAVEADVASARAKDRTHPVFDVRWLRSKEASFQLVAVTNRLDRRHATPDACGEVHLVYRLAYANAKVASRLPMTLMLVYPQAKAGGDCSSVAKRWLDAGAASKSDATARASALVAGPLAGLTTAPKAELNFQLIRWQSTTRQDMGGHAEYSLRVFDRGASGLVPATLENSLRDDLSAEERSQLGEWVAANVADIDRGTAKVPAAFVAPRTSSVSPKGLARGQNRPFAVAFGKDGSGLPNVDLAGTTVATSRAALVRRLDTMTCNGCHQSQGVAGFHALGIDRQENSDANSLVDGMSPHLRQQVVFRKTDLQAVARGTMQIAPIPSAERGPGAGGYGSQCGLGDPGFAAWTCADGFVCSNANGDQVGICVSKARRMGEACEESSVSFTADGTKDRVVMNAVLACVKPNGGGGACVRSGGNPGGFPNGMCTGGCAKIGAVEGDTICGVNVPEGFNACIARGGIFEDCVAGGSPRYRKACSATMPCGPDYVCSSVKDAPPGIGACMPPYFIFQARVDGHHVGN